MVALTLAVLLTQSAPSAVAGDGPCQPTGAPNTAFKSFEEIACWDFRAGLRGWEGNFDTRKFELTSDGLQFESVGVDPWLTSPEVDYPKGLNLRVTIRMRSDADMSGQLFYGRAFSEEASAFFNVLPDGEWHEYVLAIPPQGDETRLRLDPGSAPGLFELAWIQVGSFVPLAWPSLNPPFETVIYWDFSLWSQGWAGNIHTSNLQVTEDGLAFDTTGNDPWITGPRIDYPDESRLLLSIRMKSDADADAQLFYGPFFSEANSIRFAVNPDGDWHVYRLVLPPIGEGSFLRFDPAASPGHIVISWMAVDVIISTTPPAFDVPARPRPTTARTVTVSSEPLELIHYGKKWGGWVLRVGGQEVASSHDDGRLAFFDSGGLSWTQLSDLPVTITEGDNEIIEQISFTDESGGEWSLTRHIAASSEPGALSVTTQVETDQDRSVIHIPWITLLPGLGTYGRAKHQGLFAGLEYLADEPSSSKADVTTADHLRVVPNPEKVTMPLMVIEHEGRYIGLSWRRSTLAAPVFDSPDRVFGAKAHLMGLWAPAVGDLRLENELYAYKPFNLKAGTPLTVAATIIGGVGNSVVPAVQKYVDLRGIPERPKVDAGFDGVVELLASGWLDSELNAGDGLWRHSSAPLFSPQPASDAMVYMLWLANHTDDESLRTRLRGEVTLALTQRRKDDPAYLSGVSHIQWPITALLFGNVGQYLAEKVRIAEGYATQFDADGARHYPQVGANPKYSGSHFADHANGYSVEVLEDILEAALLSGDDDLTATGLALLSQQTELYQNSVPRGAQTWEVPLHTPDLLASAGLVNSYVSGYEITGNQEYLDQAAYWAWTGVPFVYLDPLHDRETGVYATVPVLGATDWVSPWFGLPVQWVGLVYGSALQRLAVHDPKGPWSAIGKGITAAGLQMVWPESDADRHGLLPDFFHLVAQYRGGPAINPGTVQASLAELFDVGRLYSSVRIEELDWLVHAPSTIEIHDRTESTVGFSVEGWGPDLYRVLISNVRSRPARVLVSSATTPDGYVPAPFTYLASEGWLWLELRGNSDFVVHTHNLPPRISFETPVADSEFLEPASVEISVTVTDDIGVAPARVEIEADGAVLGTFDGPPYRVVWANVEGGTHTVTATATDDLGATAELSVDLSVGEAATPTATSTVSPTMTPVRTSTATPSASPTLTPVRAVATPSASPSRTPEPAVTATTVLMPQASPSPSQPGLVSISPSPTGMPEPKNTGACGVPGAAVAFEASWLALGLLVLGLSFQRRGRHRP